MSHKRGTMISLLDRAFKICSTNLLEDELSFVKNILIQNNYPIRPINKEINKQRRKFSE